jgi:hypothetical protein
MIDARRADRKGAAAVPAAKARERLIHTVKQAELSARARAVATREAAAPRGRA